MIPLNWFQIHNFKCCNSFALLHTSIENIIHDENIYLLENNLLPSVLHCYLVFDDLIIFVSIFSNFLPEVQVFLVYLYIIHQAVVNEVRKYFFLVLHCCLQGPEKIIRSDHLSVQLKIVMTHLIWVLVDDLKPQSHLSSPFQVQFIIERLFLVNFNIFHFSSIFSLFLCLTLFIVFGIYTYQLWIQICTDTHILMFSCI